MKPGDPIIWHAQRISFDLLGTLHSYSKRRVRIVVIDAYGRRRFHVVDSKSVEECKP
jgi:hypothetical protein